MEKKLIGNCIQKFMELMMKNGKFLKKLKKNHFLGQRKSLGF